MWDLMGWIVGLVDASAGGATQRGLSTERGCFPQSFPSYPQMELEIAL
jgi:hypothetical protein